MKTAFTISAALAAAAAKYATLVVLAHLALMSDTRSASRTSMISAAKALNSIVGVVWE